MQIQDITPGLSYACKYRVEIELDELGNPHTTLNSNKSNGTGTYESIGILVQRDLDNELVVLRDEPTGMEFVIPFADIWDIDTVEWVNPITGDAE